MGSFIWKDGCVGVALGWILPGCVPVTDADVKKTLDRAAAGAVRSEEGNYRLFQQRGDGFTVPPALWETCGCLFGVRGTNS
jgi:hypothetical protein